MSNVGQIPQLRFPEFTGEWQEKRLGEITVNKPSTITASQLSDRFEGYAVYGASGIAGYVQSFQHEQPYTAVIKDGAGAGRLLWCKGETSVLSTLTGLLPRQGIDAGYLHYVLQGIDFSKYMTGSTIPHVYYRDFSKAKLKVPRLKEQQKIAAFLAAVDKRVALLECKVQQLEVYKRGVMQQLFSQQLRFTRPDGSRFPVWQEKRLGEVFDAARGSSLSWGDIEADGKNKAILYGQLYTIYPEVVSQVVSRTNSNKGTPSKKGDLLLPNSTTTTGIDLANATALNEDGVLLGGDITILRFKETGSNIFYAYYLSHFMKYKLAAYGQGSTIVHMYFSQYKNMKIVEPSAAEQQKIAAFLSVLDEKITLTRQQLDKTKQFKKGLLQRMFV